LEIAGGRAKTVNQAANEYWDVKIKHKSLNYQKLCKGTIDNYIRPAIGEMPIAKVTRDMIMNKVGLRALWETKNQTAVQVRMHLLRIFDWASHEHYLIKNEITAAWMKHALPSRGDVHQVEHHGHASVQSMDIHRFLERVRSRREGDPSTAKYRPNRYRVEPLTPLKALWLELVVVTGACRISEWRLAQWGEFDFKTMTWTVPWQHLKTGRATRRDLLRPITEPMLAALNEVKRITEDHSPEALVLPGTGGKPMGSSHLQAFIDRSVKWETKVKSHAFRSMQRDWMRSRGYDDVLWKIQADHKLGPQSDAAYGLDGQLEKRRRIQTEWSEHCTTPPLEPQQKVVSIRKR
jgi:integrase